MEHPTGHGLTFITSTSTPLYSSAWTPTTKGAYAGSCIFLILLSVALRALLALRHVLEAQWRAADLQRRYVVVAGKESVADRVISNGIEGKLLTAQGVEERVRVLGNVQAERTPWRIRREGARAGVLVLAVGVGYLL